MDLKQSIPLKSIQNARELGGYCTSDGKRVKKGLLLRTAKLNDISHEDIAILENKYQLSDIIDFRMDLEIDGMEDPTVEGAAYHQIDVMDLGDVETDLAQMQAFNLKKPDLRAIVGAMEAFGMLDGSMYIGFLEGDKGKQGFSKFFQILLNVAPDRAVLWHCTSGKDRTGLAAMLLLSALGVDKQVIMDDYLLTNTYNEKRILGLKQMLSAQGCEEAFISKAVFAFEAVDELFMRSALDHLKKKYGSVLGYLRDGLSISDAELDDLRNHYLENQ